MTCLRDDVLDAVVAAGAVAVGVCGVEPLAEARRVIEARRDAGLHHGMAFTFRNPARSTDPRRTLPWAESAVVAAVPYSSARDDRPEEPAAAVARYAADDTYRALREHLARGARVLSAAGFRGTVLADDNALVDRALAVRAGLGWLGKNTNLLVPGVGSWVVLGSILTDAPLPPTESRAGSEQRIARDTGCGTCRRCLEGCPTGALVAPGVMDASRCLSWLLQTGGSFPRRHRIALGARIYGCDDCQEVCPPNRGAPGVEAAPGVEPGRRGRHPGDWVGLRFLLGASDEELMDLLGAWYIPARNPRYVRRNALVVLGNVGYGAGAGHMAGTRTGAVLDPLLERYLRDDDPLLVEHAAWGARRAGRDQLLSDPACRDHPEVRAELARPHPRIEATLARSRASDETSPR